MGIILKSVLVSKVPLKQTNFLIKEPSNCISFSQYFFRGLSIHSLANFSSFSSPKFVAIRVLSLVSTCIGNTIPFNFSLALFYLCLCIVNIAWEGLNFLFFLLLYLYTEFQHTCSKSEQFSCPIHTFYRSTCNAQLSFDMLYASALILDVLNFSNN